MAELAKALYALPTARLRKIVETRQMPLGRLRTATNKQQMAAILAGELAQPAGITRALMLCDARALRLLQIVISMERPARVPWAHVHEQIGADIPEAPLLKAMGRLEDLGLAFRTPTGVVLPDSVSHYTPTPLSDRTSIMRALSVYDPESVKRVAEGLGVKTVPRATSVAEIRSALTGEPLRRIVERLDPEETGVLEYLIRAGGSAEPAELAAAGVGGKPDQFLRYDWQKHWRSGKPRNAIERLLSIGLIYGINYGYGYDPYLVIPAEVMRFFSGTSNQSYWTAPEPAGEPMQGAPELVRRHTGIIRDVVAFLAFLATQEAVRTSTGHIHKSSLKTAARSLSIPADEYAAFVYVLCRGAGLIDIGVSSMVYEVTERGEAWLEWDSVDQTMALVAGWRRSVLWDEMFEEPLQKDSRHAPAHDAILARNAAIGLLLESAGDSFVSVKSLAATIQYRLPLLMMEIDDERAGAPVQSPSVFISVIACESLYWLGLMEVATFPAGAGESGGPDSDAHIGVRMQAHAQYYLQSRTVGPPPLEPRETQFVLQANAEVFVSPMLAPSVLFRILSYSDTAPKGAANNTVVLSRDAIRRSLDRGKSVREMLAFLQSHSRAGIPQNVEYLINEVGARHGHIHIGQAQMYIQTDTPALMKELNARRELKSLFVRTLSDTVALLSAHEPDKVLRELRKAGYLPVSDDKPPRVAAAAGSGHPPSIHAQTQPTPEIDWDRIAREDARATARDSGPPSDAARERNTIRLLIQNVAKAGRPVELAYRPADGEEPVIREVIPTMVRGGSVLVLDTTTHEAVNLELNRIQWARIIQ